MTPWNIACGRYSCIYEGTDVKKGQGVGLDEVQAGIKTAGRNINNLRHGDDATLMVESEQLKSLLMKVKKTE